MMDENPRPEIIDERTVHHTATLCSRCGAKLDATTGIEEYHPQPGDLSVCFYCATILCFCADFTMREMPRAEIDALDAENRALILKVAAGVRRDIFDRLTGKPCLN